MLVRPSLNQIEATTQADISSRLDGSTPMLRRGFLPAISKALSGAIHGLYGFIQLLSKQLNPSTATGTYLDSWANVWGVTRKQAAFATGPAVFTGTAAAPIAAGSTLVATNGAEFAVQSALVIGGGGTVTGTVIALNAGIDGNQLAGAVLSFVSPLIGVIGTAVVDTASISGGADIEDDDAFRSRMLLRIQNPPHGGNAADYLFWALSVAPITRAWVFPTYSGAGTVRVYVANDAYSGATLASAGDVAAAQVYIDSVKPVTVVKETTPGSGIFVSGLTAIAPTKYPIAFSLSLNPITSQAAVTAALTALFKAEAAPEGSVLISHIREAIGGASGVYDYNLTTPTANVTAPAGNICTVGTITWL